MLLKTTREQLKHNMDTRNKVSIHRERGGGVGVE